MKLSEPAEMIERMRRTRGNSHVCLGISMAKVVLTLDLQCKGANMLSFFQTILQTRF